MTVLAEMDTRMHNRLYRWAKIADTIRQYPARECNLNLAQKVLSDSLELNKDACSMTLSGSWDAVNEGRMVKVGPQQSFRLAATLAAFDSVVLPEHRPSPYFYDVLQAEAALMRKVLAASYVDLPENQFGRFYLGGIRSNFPLLVMLVEGSPSTRDRADAWLAETHPALVGMPDEWVWEVLATVDS